MQTDQAPCIVAWHLRGAPKLNSVRLVWILLFASAAVSAQPADSAVARRPAWVSVSAFVANSAFVGVSAQGHIPVGRGPVVFQIGTSSTSGFFGGNVLTEGHVAVGASASAGPLFVTATVGPSVGRTFRPLNDAAVTALGGTAGIQARVVVFPFLGIGAEAFVNASAVRTVSGVGVHLSFGRLPGAVFPNAPRRIRRPGP